MDLKIHFERVLESKVSTFNIKNPTQISHPCHFDGRVRGQKRRV